MKRLFYLMLTLALVLSIGGCGTNAASETKLPEAEPTVLAIDLSAMTLSGEPISSDTTAAVYAAHDIIYYEAGHDFTYGEGTEADAHSPEEAASHTVIHITQPGTYRLQGKLPAGQIAVDLGEDAKNDPEAVVTLILNGVDITCTVAPAVIFYHVYECGDKDNPTKDVDTSAAGANVIIADSTTNYVNGSYVARIYKPDTVELSDDGTEVADAKKLHKYDAAFYSKMSMNLLSEDKGLGSLYITAENEGLDSEMHLTIDCGGTEADSLISIVSGNDGINTNEDGVSVTTINSGTLGINVTGETGEGDGIDSNGWLVINGGKVIASACSDSMDSGIDSDMGIHINGGTVLATGHMLDRIEEGGQNYAVFTFAQSHNGSESVVLKNSLGQPLFGDTLGSNDYSILLYSSPELIPGEYTLWVDGIQQAHSGTSLGGMMPRPQNGTRPELPEGFAPPEGMELPEGFAPPEGMELPEGMEIPEDKQLPPGFEMPEGNFGGHGPGKRPHDFSEESGETSTVFTIAAGGNSFGGVTAVT